MRKIASKAIPLAVVMTAPFLMHADEAIYAAGMPIISKTKVATATKSQPSVNTSSSQAMCPGQITPPAGPRVCDGADLYITADFIWWKAEQTNLSYAYNGAAGGVDEGTFSNEADATQGWMHQPHFKYKPGFKVGMGLLSAHDHWDLFAQYTWLHSSVSNSSTSSSNSILQGTDTYGFFPLGDAPTYGSASADWKLRFNVLDVELGRNFWISKRLTLRPFIGMKFSWNRETYNISAANVGSAPVTSTLDIDFKLKQLGVGLRAGIDSAYYFSNHFSLFGDFALTGLWNSIKSSRTNTFQASSATDAFTNLNVKYHPNPVTAVLEMDLGLRFETIFSKGRYMYVLQAGWENQVWFDQGQFISTNAFATPGNLSLQGLTIKTGFYF